MKQMVAFIAKIRDRNFKNEYYQTKNYASIHGVELKPLEEILSVGSNQGAPFDEAYERQAQAKLKEMKAMKELHG